MDLPFEPFTWNWYQREQAQDTVARLCDRPGRFQISAPLACHRRLVISLELRYTLLPPEMERYRHLGLELHTL